MIQPAGGAIPSGQRSAGAPTDRSAAHDVDGEPARPQRPQPERQRRHLPGEHQQAGPAVMPGQPQQAPKRTPVSRSSAVIQASGNGSPSGQRSRRLVAEEAAGRAPCRTASRRRGWPRTTIAKSMPGRHDRRREEPPRVRPRQVDVEGPQLQHVAGLVGVPHHPADADGQDAHPELARVHRPHLLGPQLGERVVVAGPGLVDARRAGANRPADHHHDRARQHQPPDPRLPAGVEDVVEPDDVGPDQLGERRVDRLRRQVNDRVHPLDRRAHRLRVGDVGDDRVDQLGRRAAGPARARRAPAAATPDRPDGRPSRPIP